VVEEILDARPDSVIARIVRRERGDPPLEYAGGSTEG